MSVLVSDRTESKFEAITYSVELHDMLIELMQRSFGVKDLDHFVRVKYAYGKESAEDFSKYRYLMLNYKNRIFFVLMVEPSKKMRLKGGKTSWIEIERFRCPVCGQIHRELPDYIFPYKQYEAEVIRGVLEGFITCETYGYEDYPCEMTMIRWRNSQELQLLL